MRILLIVTVTLCCAAIALWVRTQSESGQELARDRLRDQLCSMAFAGTHFEIIQRHSSAFVRIDDTVIATSHFGEPWVFKVELPQVEFLEILELMKNIGVKYAGVYRSEGISGVKLRWGNRGSRVLMWSSINHMPVGEVREGPWEIGEGWFEGRE